jgi:hypothetical protein
MLWDAIPREVPDEPCLQLAMSCMYVVYMWLCKHHHMRHKQNRFQLLCGTAVKILLARCSENGP